MLVADDESDARELTVRALEHSGARVVAVSSSAEAIATLASSVADALHVLVSDIGMPARQDGYDFIREVRSLGPERGGLIPAVALTGYATPEGVDRALTAGYQVHILKPMDPTELVRAIAELMRLRH